MRSKRHQNSPVSVLLHATQWPNPVFIQLQISFSFYLDDTVQFLVGTNLALSSFVRHATAIARAQKRCF